MPQPCWIETPWRAKARISASGTAAPPTSERMPVGSFQRVGPFGQRALVGLDQAQPDRRHAERHRRRLQRHQVEQVVGVQVRPGEHQLGAVHHRAVRDAPAVGVEHRRRRHHDVGVAHAPVVGGAGHQRVQHRRAVRIDHALGPPGGARRVAHRHRVVLVVRRRSRSRRIGVGEQRLVVDEVRIAPGARRTGTRSPSRSGAAARTAGTAAAGCRRRSGSGLAHRRRSSRARRATAAGSACASRRRPPECRSSTPGGRGGSSSAWPRGRRCCKPSFSSAAASVRVRAAYSP